MPCADLGPSVEVGEDRIAQTIVIHFEIGRGVRFGKTIGKELADYLSFFEESHGFNSRAVHPAGTAHRALVDCLEYGSRLRDELDALNV